MRFAVRFVAMTFNIWRDTRWPERREACQSCIELLAPDILCYQEVRPEILDLTDTLLPKHGRVRDEFEGWSYEGNIYWNTQLFEKLDYGTESIGVDDSLRRLFWARLRAQHCEETILVSTAHYTFQGTDRERIEGFSPRLKQARLTVEALGKLRRPDEAVLFMGDLNDSVNAIRILREAGFTDSFSALGLPLVPTHPAIPTSPGRLPQVIDWQFHEGPLRVMNTSVVDFFHGDIAPSDHKPVVTTYAFTG
jgi:endonuclease/exonuclease/phosphatase family metal-dependent hydrolase